MDTLTTFTEDRTAVENSTFPYTEEAPKHFKHGWIISQIFTVFMLVICVWSIAAFYRYGRRKGRWDTSNKEQFTLMMLATLAPSILMLKLVNSQVVILIGLVNNQGERGDSACEVALDSTVAFYALSVLPTYFYLWKRQQILYSQPFLSHLDTMCIKVLSYAAGIFILVADIVIAVLYIEPNDYQLSEVGCVLPKVSIIEPLYQTPSFLAGGGLVISQLWIFALLVYPLRAINTTTEEGNRSFGPSENLQRKIKRANLLAVISMAICMFSDMCAMVLVAVVIPIINVNTPIPGCVIVTVYDFSLMVNTFSLMLSHEDFKQTAIC